MQPLKPLGTTQVIGTRLRELGLDSLNWMEDGGDAKQNPVSLAPECWSFLFPVTVGCNVRVFMAFPSHQLLLKSASKEAQFNVM